MSGGESVPPAAAHVFVDDVDVPELGAPDDHHLRRVLRLRRGEEVTVADGAGRWRRCRLGTDGRLDPESGVTTLERPLPPITVALAPGKGERPEWAVQKLTEVGVDRIVPFTASRSVVRWSGPRAAAHVDRLRRVAREAAVQSRRAWLPVVEEVTTFAGVVMRPGAVLATPGGDPPALERSVVLVGPEGGWADEELAWDVPRMGLGALVVRSETAAVAAGVLMAALRAGVVASAAGDRG